MKNLLHVSLIIIFSCNKQFPEIANQDISTVQVAAVDPKLLQQILTESLSSADVILLDLDRVIRNGIPKSKELYLRIALKTKNIENDFLLLRLDQHYRILRGRFVHVERGKTVRVRSIDLRSSTYREPEYYSGTTTPLEEVVVSSGGSGTELYIWYYNLGGMVGMPMYEPYYAPATPYTGSGQPLPELIEIEYDSGTPAVSINLEKYFKCFDLIADDGASYTIKLNVDIPVNNDPTSSVLTQFNSATGHVFLSLTKSNGSNSITQVFGFLTLHSP